MRYSKHHDRHYGFNYYKIGSHKIVEDEVIDHWMNMCGEEAIRKYLKQCTKDDGYTKAQFKTEDSETKR